MIKNILLALCLIISPLAFSGEGIRNNSIQMDALQLKEVSKTKYYIGGVLGTLPGFGIGHAIQGRWKEKGWIFTAGELTAAAGFLYFVIKSTSSLPSAKEIVNNYSKSDSSSTNLKGPFINGLVSLAFLTLFLGFKAVETVDVWSFSSHHYKVAEEKIFQISPSYYSYNGKNMIGLSLNLKW